MPGDGGYVFRWAFVRFGNDQNDGHPGNGQFEQRLAHAVVQAAVFDADYNAVGQTAAGVIVDDLFMGGDPG